MGETRFPPRSGTLVGLLRRPLVLASLAAALIVAGSASAALQPVKRTFGVVKETLPLGNPAGYWNPAELKNGFVWSIPSSTTPILIPAPLAPVAASSCGAPMSDGLSSRFSA